MKLIHLPILFIIIFTGIVSCTDKKYSDIEKDIATKGILLQIVTNTNAPGVDCSTAAISFSALGAAGLNTQCGSCHATGAQKSIVDTSSYTSVKTKVTAGIPTASVFYTSINSGSMSTYTNTALTKAVYCWIKAGALE